ncbi:MAG TPA: hypothetical protein VFH89_04845 [Sphingomicrobium sp.]|nr:hypothetical protein [Sphingomicrobium sp.]
MLRQALLVALLSGSSLALSAPLAPAVGARDEAAAAVEALDKVSEALSGGDRSATDSALQEARKQLAALEASASEAKSDADERGRFCETKSIEVTNTIAEAYADQTRNEALLKDLDAKVAGNAERMKQLDLELQTLKTQQDAFVEEANFRQKCANDGWFYFKTGRCWELGFKDLFENRVTNLNQQAADRRETRARLQSESWTAGSEAERLREQQGSIGREIERLKAERAGLDARSGELRKTATSLSTLALFWGQLETSAGGRSLNQVRLAILTLSFDRDLSALDPTQRRQVEDARAALTKFRDYRSKIAAAGSTALSCA